MKTATGRLAPALGIALIVTVNAVVLTGVWYNHSGTPDATVVLTERELPMGTLSAEDTVVALNLNWQRPSGDWLNGKKLETLGFDVARIKSWDKAKTLRYGKDILPRRAFVVLEYNGPAWANVLHKREEALAELKAKAQAGIALKPWSLKIASNELDYTRHVASRLFGVDVGSNAEALRKEYPDRTHYLIVPAVVRAFYGWSAKDNRNKLTGLVTTLLPSSLHVSATQSRRLPPVKIHGRYANYDGPPRYEVTVHYGRRHEGWIADIQPLTRSKTPSTNNGGGKPAEH